MTFAPRLSVPDNALLASASKDASPVAEAGKIAHASPAVSSAPAQAAGASFSDLLGKMKPVSGPIAVALPVASSLGVVASAVSAETTPTLPAISSADQAVAPVPADGKPQPSVPVVVDAIMPDRPGGASARQILMVPDVRTGISRNAPLPRAEKTDKKAKGASTSAESSAPVPSTNDQTPSTAVPVVMDASVAVITGPVMPPVVSIPAAPTKTGDNGAMLENNTTGTSIASDASAAPAAPVGLAAKESNPVAALSPQVAKVMPASTAPATPTAPSTSAAPEARAVQEALTLPLGAVHGCKNHPEKHLVGVGGKNCRRGESGAPIGIIGVFFGR